ncbi:MAG: FtsW/RodA/SpoVE family cell cycle protein [Alistipes sp.]|jgi:cell division protein FtsW|nr:FtsW/RodA/SpoVE family cell cycle protein [Alistipes sp.]
MSNDAAKSWTWRPGGDRALWGIILILAVVSVVVVYSSTGAAAFSGGRLEGSHLNVLIRQAGIVAMGLVAIYAIHKINYQVYGRMVWFLYSLALVFTVMVYFIGEVNPAAPDAPRWIRIPIINFTFQPSDFLKVATVMVVARELARRQKTIAGEDVIPPLTSRAWRERKGARTLVETTMPIVAPIILSCGVILPANLSTALILFATCFVVLFIGRVRVRELVRMVMVLALLAALAVGFLYAIGRPPKRMETWVGRFERFAAADGTVDTYQVDQAAIAIAAGKLAGRGAGGSIQRGLLPDAESDYAYAFIIEEYGSIFGGLIVLMYVWIFFRGIAIFRKCGTAFPSLLVLGLALLITLQALVNMMVSTDMIPSTGVALPLISKGGSSELFLSCALGMMLGVSRQTGEKTLDKPRAESLLEINRTEK